MVASRMLISVLAISASLASSVPVVQAGANMHGGKAHTAVGSTDEIAYRGGHGQGGSHGYYGHHRHGFRGAGIVGGIIAGALIAGAIRESRAGSSDIERCESAYRSFDADTGTYMGYDGERHVCPYLE